MSEDYFYIRREYMDWCKQGKTSQEFKDRFLAIGYYALDHIKTDTKIPESILKSIEEDRLIVDKERRGEARKTPEYKEWRMSVFKRDHFTCQLCGQVGGTLNAHHIRPYAKYPKGRLDVNNGITLCLSCHRRIHRKRR